MMIGQRPRDWGQPTDYSISERQLDVPGVTLPQGQPEKRKLNWGAIIADALSGLAGQQGQYPARVERERAEQTDFERGEMRYQRQRADGEADWQRRQQWEEDHRQPTGFGAELAAAGYQPGTPEYTQKYQQYVGNRLDPYVTAPLPNGVYSGPRSGIAALGGPMNTSPKPPPPQTAIEELRHDPSGAAEFDEMFGEGAAARILGGAGSPAPRSFP